MEEPQFFEWFSSVFVPWVNSLRATHQLHNQAAVLFFDGHTSHISMRIVKTAIDNNIHLVKFPSHLTDKIQPLDKCVFRPIKKLWEAKLVEFVKTQLQNRESARLTKNMFFELLGEIWTTGMKTRNIVKGFESTGLFPVNAAKFPESAFNPVVLRKYKIMNNEDSTTKLKQATVEIPENERSSSSGVVLTKRQRVQAQVSMEQPLLI